MIQANQTFSGETNIFNPAGKVIRRSKNLRGVIDYARKSNVVKIETFEIKSRAGHEKYKFFNGFAKITFADGCTSLVQFCSFTVMLDWFDTRKKRSKHWSGAELVHVGDVV